MQIIFLFLTITLIESIPIKNEFYRKGMGRISSISSNKDIFFYSKEDGLLTKTDNKGEIKWRRTVEKNGKRITSSLNGVYLLLDETIQYYDSRGELDFGINVKADDIHVFEQLYVLNGNILEKRNLKDGKIIQEETINNPIKFVENGLMTKEGIISLKTNEILKIENLSIDKYYKIKDEKIIETECETDNGKICVMNKNGIIIGKNIQTQKIEFENDETKIIDTIMMRGKVCYIRSSGNIYCIFDNEEILIKNIYPSNNYLLFNLRDEKIYSDEIATKELIEKEIGILDFNGRLYSNVIVQMNNIKIAKRINGGILIIYDSNKVYSIGESIENKYIVADSIIYQIVNNTAIERRNYKNKKIFTSHPQEKIGIVGRAQIDRDVKVPLFLKSLGVVVDDKTIDITELISGKIIHSVKLPVDTLKTECTIMEGIVSCFITTITKKSYISTIEIYEQELDWDLTQYDVYNLPEFSVRVQNTLFTNMVDLATISVSELGINNKVNVLYTQNHICSINPEMLLGTKPRFEMKREDMLSHPYPYVSNITITKDYIISHELNLNIDGLKTHPGNLESSTIVIGYGIDLYTSEFTPLYSFDNPQQFNKQQLLITLGLVVLVTIVLHIFAARKGK